MSFASQSHEIYPFKNPIPGWEGLRACHLDLGVYPKWQEAPHLIRIGDQPSLINRQDVRAEHAILAYFRPPEIYQLVDIYPRPDSVIDIVLKWLDEFELLSGHWVLGRGYKLPLEMARAGSIPTSDRWLETAISLAQSEGSVVYTLCGVPFIDNFVSNPPGELGAAIVELASEPALRRIDRLISHKQPNGVIGMIRNYLLERKNAYAFGQLNPYLILDNRQVRMDPPNSDSGAIGIPRFSALPLISDAGWNRYLVSPIAKWFPRDYLLVYLTLLGQTQLSPDEINAFLAFVAMPALGMTSVDGRVRHAGSCILLRLIVSFLPNLIRKKLIEMKVISGAGLDDEGNPSDPDPKYWVELNGERFYTGPLILHRPFWTFYREAHTLATLIGTSHPGLWRLFRSAEVDASPRRPAKSRQEEID